MTDLDIGMKDWLCEPLAWDDARTLRPRQGDDRRGARGRQGIRPLPRRRRRRHSVPHLPGHAPDQGRATSRAARRKDRYARYTEEGPAYVDNMQRLLRKFETAKDAGAAAGAAQGARAPTRFGVDLLRLDQPGDGRGARRAAGEGHPPRRAAHARVPVPATRSPSSSPRTSTCSSSSRTATRSCACCWSTSCGIDPARLISVLHYDGTPITARFITARDRREARARCSTSTPIARDRAGCRMTYLAKPKLHHPTLPSNKLGFTRRDYEGEISTLCAGCGHDSISAAIIQACLELDIAPHRVAKLSGIGCSSKTPDYFLGASHGFNSVHGRMPSVLTGANLANRDLIYLGVSRRRRLGVDRPRPVRARDAARRQHGLHRREQRRLRPDQGPVLGHRRPGQQEQDAARSTATSRSTWSRWRCSSARPSSRAASPATRSSSCR